MAPGGAEDASGVSVQEERTEELSEQPPQLPASGEAGRRAQRGKRSSAPDTQPEPLIGTAASADAAEPAAATKDVNTGQGQQRKRKREDAPDTQAIDAAAEALRERLAAAAARFAVLPQKPQLWLEADLAARLGPFEMVGRTVRIYWPADDAWYLATIAGYNEGTGKHLVRLASWLALLLADCGE